MEILVGSIGIILISTLLTFCTTLSMSAICTNGEIGIGGIYYMISRSLGAEAGSMIGITFSLAKAILVSLNLVGAAETTVQLISVCLYNKIDMACVCLHVYKFSWWLIRMMICMIYIKISRLI